MPCVSLTYEEIDLIMSGSAPSDDDLMEKLAKARAEPSERDVAIVSIAREQHQKSGEVEIDDPSDGIATVSEGDDNGAYVLAWVWADFEGTELDKDNCCSECGDCLSDAGDGFDGKCASCADAEENGPPRAAEDDEIVEEGLGE